MKAERAAHRRPAAEIAGQHGLGHAPNHVAINSTIKHERAGLYS